MRYLHVVLASVLGFGCASSRSEEVRSAPPAGERAAVPDVTKPGVYRADRWEYRLVVVAPGSKSEGYRGELLIDGQPVPDGVLGDYYPTPWGDIGWVGDPEVLWGEHGWMWVEPRAPGSIGRRLEPPPVAAAAVPPSVMAMVLGAGRDGIPLRVEPWVHTAMQALGAPDFHVEHPWFPLTGDEHVVHDTKMHGSLAVRLAPPRDAATLTVLFDGTSAQRVPVPRTTGATHVVRHVLDAGLDPLELWIALRVDEAGPAWPAPLVIGPDDAGQVVPVRGVASVIVALPGDRDSGLVWMVKGLDGTAVRHVGAPRFTRDSPPTPGRGGTFENELAVTGAGRVEVALELRRPWQEGVAAERTFCVTLDVAPLRSE